MIIFLGAAVEGPVEAVLMVAALVKLEELEECQAEVEVAEE